MSQGATWAVTGLAILLLAPTLVAERGTLEVSSRAPVLLDGRVTIVAEGGALHLYDPGARGTYVLQNATGWLRVYTVQAANSQTSPRIVQSIPGTLDVQEFALEGADVAFRLSEERFELRAASQEGGAITAEGSLSQEGLPKRLAERVETKVSAGFPVLGPPESVPVRWEAGWTFAGEYDAYAAVPLDGFPAPQEAATLGLRGGVHLHAIGGVVSFEDDAGQARSFRTGNWSERDGTGPEVETRRDVFFDGVVEGARIGAGPSWGVGAPDAAWRFEGEIAWTDASGRAAVNGTTRAFSHQPVRGRGVIEALPDPPALAEAPRGEVAYSVAGEWESLRVGGAQLVEPDGVPLAAIAGASLAALLLARVATALYTRLAAGDLLRNPQRRRIHQEVEGDPGVHLRELHRRVGGGWSAFRVHLHLLQRGGYVRVERSPHYALVFPAHAAARAVAIPHPLARAVYEALPLDGSAVPLSVVRERVGTTRQLLNYHAQRLRDAGIIDLTRSTRGGRLASRLK